MTHSKPPSENTISVTIRVRPPYGYRIVGDRIEVDPIQAERITSLFRQYVRSR